jgi:hypothetical protein
MQEDVADVTKSFLQVLFNKENLKKYNWNNLELTKNN